MNAEYLYVDGSIGEGGGQVLRTSLALSMVTGKPMRIEQIRARRNRPGLQRQHLAAVYAAAQVAQAEIEGAYIGSQELSFSPGEVKPGEYDFNVGSAGSCTLVLQTVLPALWRADGASTLLLTGGTHNPMAPPFEFMEQTYLPLAARIGLHCHVQLHRPGFYPAGGGELEVTIAPATDAGRLELLERGQHVRTSAVAVVAELADHIPQRELRVVAEKLQLHKAALRALRRNDSQGPGNVVFVTVEHEHVAEVFTAFGRRGVPAEEVANDVVQQVQTYLDSGVPVSPHLADQLLLPLALGAGGSFVTSEPSSHTVTNIETIRRFLPELDVVVSPIELNRWRVDITPLRFGPIGKN